MDRHAIVGSDRKEKLPHGVSYPRSHPYERDDVTIYLNTDSSAVALAVCKWAINEKLAPVEVRPSRIKVAGSLENLEAAFGVELHERDVNDEHYRSHCGPVYVPAQFSDVTIHVAGLDTRKVAQPRLKKGEWKSFSADELTSIHGVSESDGILWGHPRKQPQFNKPPGTFTPLEVAQLYGFPDGSGEGQTIALIELGGGYRSSDLTAYWSYLGITGPTVSSVSVDGGRNAPGSDADAEVMLDIEVAGAVAPKAKIAVYFTGNTEQGFLDAISTAIHDEHTKPSVISISWGSAESSWTPASMTAMSQIIGEAQAAGITILVASGDNGSSDGVEDGASHVDFPASSPGSLGCGGSALVASGNAIVNETVWNDGGQGGAGGGGYSAEFARPAYQPASIGTHRGVPDVAGCADPDTGYVVRVDGQFTIVGGTSAVAPLYAGLIARINAITGKRAGQINSVLYSNPSACRDITSGNNGAYEATQGWDAATGLGSVNGTKLLSVLQSLHASA
jgi:kumamolisin